MSKSKPNAFEVVERDKHAHDKTQTAVQKAIENSRKATATLTKSRDQFWQIVGNPPYESLLAQLCRRYEFASHTSSMAVKVGIILALTFFAAWIVEMFAMVIFGVGLLIMALFFLFKIGVDEDKLWAQMRTRRST